MIWWRDLRLRWKLLSAVGLLALVMLAQNGFTAWTTLTTLESNQHMLKSMLVIQDANRVQEGLINMESGYRGFLLAGTDDFLEPYDAGRQSYGSALADLRQESADDPAQVARWQDLGQRAATWQREVTEPGIALRRAVSAGSATMQDVASLVGNRQGKRQFDAMRQVFGEAIQVEQQELAQAVAASQAAADRLRLVLVIGSAVAIGTALAIAFFQERAFGGTMVRLAAAAEQVASGDLGRRLHLARRDEIGQTAAAFDHMADELQATIQRAEAGRATLASVMGSLNDGLLVVDEMRRLRYANGRVGALLGVDLAPFIGMEAADALPLPRPVLADPEAAAVAWQQALARPDEASSFELRVVGPPPRDLLAQVFPVADGQAHWHVGVLLRDVSAERDLARTKDELVGVVSHELRTPVASLVGFAELLLTRDYAEPQRREFLGVMLREGRRLTALINDFLDLQRLESGAQQIALATTALRPVVERAVAAAGEDAATPIVLVIPDALPLVLADADRIEQVLGNLLSNARKYSPAGGQIRVAAELSDGYVQVAVADHGLGIPAEALPRMFEKFYRVDNSDRRTIKGTGLGLAIVRNMVEAHKGRIRAESAGLGQGSTFTFTLPVSHSTIAPPAAPAPVADGGAGPAGTHVLVVEDDPAFALWLSETLAGAGYAVRVAPSGEEALQAVAHARPTAVLLDLTLAGQLDGWDALAVLRSRSDTADLPVIVVSSREEHARGHALGVAEYLVKPVGADALLRTLRRLGGASMRAVLVVEDDAATRQAIVAALAEAGFPATGVCSGQEALAALDAETAAFELLVLDLDLPDMDSFAILEAIRSQRPTRTLPVLVISARDLTDTEQGLIAARAAELVRKHDDSGVPIVEAVSRLYGGPAHPTG